jgi:phosphohistidine phosphatase
MNMRLYLARHAEAASKQKDKIRGLTPKGIRDAQALAGFVRLLGVKVASIWHSGKPRSVQTAEVLASAFHARRNQILRPDINPNSPARPVAKLIQKARKDLLIVGHQPFLGKLACKLLGRGATPAMLNLAKASILCLEYRDDRGWQIEWMINPETAYAFFAQS